MTSKAPTRARAGLVPAGSHGSWPTYLGRIWERRFFLWHIPRSELQNRNMGTVLGGMWNLINPALSIAIYYLIFGLLLETDRGVDNFLTFLAVGIFVFQYTQKSTLAGAGSILRNRGLMRSISFPRAIVPLAAVITELLAFLPGVCVFLTVALLTGESPTTQWLLVAPLIMLQTVFNAGAALTASRMTVAFRDIKNLLPFVFRLLFYSSGVLFNVESYLENDRLRWLFILNPMYDFLSLYRWAVLGSPTSTAVTVSALSWSAALSVLGLVWFRHNESSYAI